MNFHRVRGPGRPFLLAYPWFLLAASLTVARRARGVLQVTGGLVLNRADVVSVHYCHQVGPANPSRAGALYRANIRLVEDRQATQRAGRLPPQPRGGLRLRLRGRRRRGSRALPGAGVERDRDPQRRGPGALRAGTLERAGKGRARAAGGRRARAGGAVRGRRVGAQGAASGDRGAARRPRLDAGGGRRRGPVPLRSARPLARGARAHPLAGGAAGGGAAVRDGGRVRAADQLRDLLAGHLRGRRQRPAAARGPGQRGSGAARAGGQRVLRSTAAPESISEALGQLSDDPAAEARDGPCGPPLLAALQLGEHGGAATAGSTAAWRAGKPRERGRRRSL